MGRKLLAGLATVGGLLVFTTSAVANVGDITDLTVGEVSVAADGVVLQGEITCAASLEYGLIAKVTQPPGAAGPNSDSNGDAEGVGAFGPNFAGVDDDQPCGTSAKAFDLAVQKNAESEDFDPNGDTGYSLTGATTADNGNRGPGPFIGDLSQVVETDGGGETPLPASCADIPDPVLRALCEQLEGGLP